MNELVQLTTQDVTKAVPVTNSKIIAEMYEVEHHTVTRLLRKYQTDFEEFGKVGFEIQSVESGQSDKTYLVNEDQFFLLVTFMKNTDIARKAKVQYVKAFSTIKKELQARSETRHI